MFLCKKSSFVQYDNFFHYQITVFWLTSFSINCALVLAENFKYLKLISRKFRKVEYLPLKLKIRKYPSLGSPFKKYVFQGLIRPLENQEYVATEAKFGVFSPCWRLQNAYSFRKYFILLNHIKLIISRKIGNFQY